MGRTAPRSLRARLLRAVGVALLAALLLPPAVVLALRFVPPPTSAFMLQSQVKPVRYRWVPAERIAETARRAVVAAEDQKFWTHGGFDFEAIEKAYHDNRKRRRKRGASTISQQTAKNLFLWPGRSWLRKGLEVSFTVLLEWMWPKERILEVYLNIVEFGPGIYGVEAAAQAYFHKGAARLTPTEAARLAAVLPSPRRWKPDRPGPYVAARGAWILAQMGYGARTRQPPAEAPPAPTAVEPAPPQPAVPAADPAEELAEAAEEDGETPLPAEAEPEPEPEPEADAAAQP